MLNRISVEDETIISTAKCQDFFAYLFEFGYDLAISPDMNVSCSPGFEAFQCIYGGPGV
jgi:hypothetical protein